MTENTKAEISAQIRARQVRLNIGPNKVINTSTPDAKYIQLILKMREVITELLHETIQTVELMPCDYTEDEMEDVAAALVARGCIFIEFSEVMGYDHMAAFLGIPKEIDVSDIISPKKFYVNFDK